MNRLGYTVLALLLLGAAPPGLAQPGNEPLPPDEAFTFNVAFKDRQTLIADLTPAKNHYLYKSKIRFAVKTPGGVLIKEIRLPTGETKSDPFFGAMEIYRKPIQAEIALDRRGTARRFTLVAAYQGCNEKIGLCYPPMEKTVDLVLP